MVLGVSVIGKHFSYGIFESQKKKSGIQTFRVLDQGNASHKRKLDVLGWCKSNCCFALLNSVVDIEIHS